MKRKLISICLVLMLVLSSMAMTGCGLRDDKNLTPNADGNLENGNLYGDSNDNMIPNPNGLNDDLDADRNDLDEDLREDLDDLGNGIKDGAEDLKDGVEDVMDGKKN